MRRRQSNEHTISVQLPEYLFDNIKNRASQYKLTRSAFVRALLDAIDDRKMYSNLIGPAENKLK